MSLKERLAQDMKSALKSRQSVWLSTIRMLMAAVKNKEIALRRELDERETIECVVSQARLRKEAIEQFKLGGRQDLVEKEEQELKYLEDYMPTQLTAEEVALEISRAVEEAQATGLRDLGRVMKILIPRISGRADNKTVSELAKEMLAQKGG